jgi:hypothetical protein
MFAAPIDGAARGKGIEASFSSRDRSEDDDSVGTVRCSARPSQRRRRIARLWQQRSLGPLRPGWNVRQAVGQRRAAHAGAWLDGGAHGRHRQRHRGAEVTGLAIGVKGARYVGVVSRGRAAGRSTNNALALISNGDRIQGLFQDWPMRRWAAPMPGPHRLTEDKHSVESALSPCAEKWRQMPQHEQLWLCAAGPESGHHIASLESEACVVGCSRCCCLLCRSSWSGARWRRTAPTKPTSRPISTSATTSTSIRPAAKLSRPPMMLPKLRVRSTRTVKAAI